MEQTWTARARVNVEKKTNLYTCGILPFGNDFFYQTLPTPSFWSKYLSGTKYPFPARATSHGCSRMFRTDHVFFAFETPIGCMRFWKAFCWLVENALSWLRCWFAASITSSLNHKHPPAPKLSHGPVSTQLTGKIQWLLSLWGLNEYDLHALFDANQT